MFTQHIKVSFSDFREMDKAAKAIQEGKLVAFPTETVYGLGANALNPQAVLSIFEAKGRPDDNPLIVHIAEKEMLQTLVTEIKPWVERLICAFWPGPLTLVFQKTSIIPDITTAGLDTVAIRMPDHTAALELIRRAGVPVAAPSANRSGRPSPTLAEHVAEDLDGRIEMILDGGACTVGVESTVLDVTVEPPCILRPGGVTLEMIREVIGQVALDQSLVEKQALYKPKSPGMKYVHYAPRGELFVVSGEGDEVVQWVTGQLDKDRKEGKKPVVITSTQNSLKYEGNQCIPYGKWNDASEVASNIFRIFRECDHMGADRIYIEAIPLEGLGLAVMNRIEKAAGGKTIHLKKE